MPLTAREFALEVTQKLQAGGFQALWAGGCVRDQLLGKTPKDYDVATNATPPQVRQLFGRKRTLELGVAFGVITVIGPRSAGNIEVATFRRDAGYSDGRHPDSVEYSTAEHDARRRDFTINGLFYDPLVQEIIDYVGGQQDLEQRIIRAIGDPAERIAEDKLRMLRAVRFASVLDFRMEEETLRTIQRHAPQIGIVSMERISAELTRMLLHANRVRAVELLARTNLLVQILPETGPLIDESALFQGALASLKKLTQPSLAVALATLVGPLTQTGPEQFLQLCRRLKLPNSVGKEGAWILGVVDVLAAAPAIPWSTLQPLLTHPHIEDALQFMSAFLSTAGLDQKPVEFCRERLRWPPERLDPPALLSGGILQQQGFRQGPRYSEILRETRRAQLDGEITTTAEALEIARRIVAG